MLCCCFRKATTRSSCGGWPERPATCRSCPAWRPSARSSWCSRPLRTQSGRSRETRTVLRCTKWVSPHGTVSDECVWSFRFSNYMLHLLTHTVVRNMSQRRWRLRGGEGENRKFLHNPGPFRGEFKCSVQIPPRPPTPCANTSCVFFFFPPRQSDGY